MKPMMRCGHAANATKLDKPVCAICIGITPDAQVVDENPPDLTGREAECPYCKRRAPSNPSMVAFFEHRPNSPLDTFYCGCRGWD